MFLKLTEKNSEEFKKFFSGEGDPDELFGEIDKTLEKVWDQCFDVAETEPEGAAQLLSFALQIASTAYSRAAFLKLKQLEKRLGLVGSK